MKAFCNNVLGMSQIACFCTKYLTFGTLKCPMCVHAEKYASECSELLVHLKNSEWHDGHFTHPTKRHLSDTVEMV